MARTKSGPAPPLFGQTKQCRVRLHKACGRGVYLAAAPFNPRKLCRGAFRFACESRAARATQRTFLMGLTLGGPRAVAATTTATGSSATAPDVAMSADDSKSAGDKRKRTEPATAPASASASVSGSGSGGAGATTAVTSDSTSKRQKTGKTKTKAKGKAKAGRGKGKGKGKASKAAAAPDDDARADSDADGDAEADPAAAPASASADAVACSEPSGTACPLRTTFRDSPLFDRNVLPQIFSFLSAALPDFRDARSPHPGTSVPTAASASASASASTSASASRSMIDAPLGVPPPPPPRARVASAPTAAASVAVAVAVASSTVAIAEVKRPAGLQALPARVFESPNPAVHYFSRCTVCDKHAGRVARSVRSAFGQKQRAPQRPKTPRDRAYNAFVTRYEGHGTTVCVGLASKKPGNAGRARRLVSSHEFVRKWLAVGFPESAFQVLTDTDEVSDAEVFDFGANPLIGVVLDGVDTPEQAREQVERLMGPLPGPSASASAATSAGAASSSSSSAASAASREWVELLRLIRDCEIHDVNDEFGATYASVQSRRSAARRRIFPMALLHEPAPSAALNADSDAVFLAANADAPNPFGLVFVTAPNSPWPSFGDSHHFRETPTHVSPVEQAFAQRFAQFKPIVFATDLDAGVNVPATNAIPEASRCPPTAVASAPNRLDQKAAKSSAEIETVSVAIAGPTEYPTHPPTHVQVVVHIADRHWYCARPIDPEHELAPPEADLDADADADADPDADADGDGR